MGISVDRLPRSGATGIFWAYGTDVLACSRPLAEGGRLADCLGSPDAHVERWPSVQAIWAVTYPRLTSLAYDQVPRGRVIFQLDRQRFVVYLDRRLLAPAWKAAIRASFDLPVAGTIFRTDLHYTTGPPAIARLLDD